MQKIFGLIIILLAVLADQLSKWAISEKFFRPALGLGDPMRLADWLKDAPERLGYISLPICPYFNLSLVWNEGISFGLMHGQGAIVLIGMSLAIAILFFIWMLRSKDSLEITSLGLIIGGALGNMFDRLRFGGVIDFIDIYAKGVHFPAFNVADAAISAGVAGLLIGGLFFATKSD